MGHQRGIACVAYGPSAHREYEACAATIRQHHQLPITTLTDNGPDSDLPSTSTTLQRSRWAKVNLLNWAPYDQILYLDVDTRVRADLSAGFAILDDGWDLALTPSGNQGDQWLWHVGDAERQEVRELWGYKPLQLQCGVMFVRRNRRTAAFFDRWAFEWRGYAGEDQGAFLRALLEAPVRVWLLGAPWNSATGAIINHLFGRTRGHG